MPDSRTVADRFARSLAVTGRGLRALLLTIAALAASLGLLAMTVGALSWQHADQWRVPVGILIVVLLCLPAVLLPVLVHRRLAPLTRSIERPDHLTAQARDYVADVRAGTELADIAALASGPTSIWRPRGLWQAARLVGSFTGRITPDSTRHPLLAAFMPVYLRTLWLVVIVTAWALVVATAVLAGSLVAVLLGWTPTS
ncbi:hypothetical protein MUG78_15325 [Gordonia alkaliphila]|uniref:hypothetical protein n=1 Tax=Gordonia alkaliphila TaxID=1053547 RepID=UPI001FF36564|nr:hypothetical protein [Gordonia alkaliphila]MCK0440786.1 hypothetical protein [Gordonia alkaliphila]